ncbi:PEGA domain-containing protein [bacterium]|nr:PEGA domain-containing protein [bacterium]
MKILKCVPVAWAVLVLAGCGAYGSVGVGIPHTPISVGVSAPLAPSAYSQGNAVYRSIRVESVPAGAEIRINNQTVGSAPGTFYVPFQKTFWSGVRGTAQLTAYMQGYRVEGVKLFAVSSGSGISTSPAGAPIGTLTINMREATEN